MRKFFCTFVVMQSLLIGCTTTNDLDSKSEGSNKDGVFISENYQSVYARTSRMAKNCLPNGPAGLLSPVTNVVETNLYNELGYGEIKHYQRNLSIIPYANVKIAKSNSGTLIIVHTANMLEFAQNNLKNNIIGWAKGNISC